MRKYTLFNLAAASLLIASIQPAMAAAERISTSPLWAANAQYHACNVFNASASTINVRMILYKADSTRAQDATVTLPPWTSAEKHDSGSASGFATCTFLTARAASIRASQSVYFWNGTYFEVHGVSEAR